MEATRQMIGDTIRKLPVDSPVRTDLIHLRGALDDTMTNAAKQSGNPEVAQSMQNLRSAYATKVQAFDANAIKALADKNPDSVAGALLNKQSVFNVNTLRSLIGSGNMRPVEGSLLQRLVDNSSAGPDGFNPKSFVGSFNRLGPDVQKAIWGDNLPAVQAFLGKAANVPAGSPVWGGLARYVEHRAIFDVLAGGVIFGAGALHDQFSGKRLLGPAAILAGVIALHNPRVLAETSRFLQLGAAAAAPIASSAMTPEPEETPEPEPTPAQVPISSNATIGEQLIAKAAQAQQQKARLAAQEAARPALPFHPGAGILR
jgi:hypothetical protein